MKQKANGLYTEVIKRFNARKKPDLVSDSRDKLRAMPQHLREQPPVNNWINQPGLTPTEE
jgi:hypothetical protein